jgi:hypothetical protein
MLEVHDAVLQRSDGTLNNASRSQGQDFCLEQVHPALLPKKVGNDGH